MRRGSKLFRRKFTRALTWGKELFVDATKVHANASLDSVKPRFVVDSHLRELFSTGEEGEPEQPPHMEPLLPTSEAAPSPPETIREEATPQSSASVSPPSLCESTGTAPVPLPICLEDGMREDLTRANEQRHDWVEQQGRPQREVTRGSYRRMADFVVSTTDPDATLMPTKGEGRHLGYHTHYVVDGGKSRIILAALVTPSEVMENQPMLDLVFRARFRWKLWPRQITGDTIYGTIDNIVAVEDQHMRAYVPLPDFDKRTSLYGKQAFRYDPERDVYICPNNAILPLHTHAYDEREKRYQGDAATRNACPLKAQCTTSDQGRLLKRSFDEEYLEQVRAYHATEPYQKAMRKRSVWVEPLFAEGKQWHGMRRFRLRLLWRVNIEGLLIASGQNLKRLLKKRGWGRRPFPAEGLCALFLAAFGWFTST